MTDRQMEGQLDSQTEAGGKTIFLPTRKGGDIIHDNVHLFPDIPTRTEKNLS